MPVSRLLGSIPLTLKTTTRVAYFFARSMSSSYYEPHVGMMDFDETGDPGAFKKAWNQQMKDWFRASTEAANPERIFDPTTIDGTSKQPVTRVKVTWNAFPQVLSGMYGPNSGVALNYADVTLPSIGYPGLARTSQNEYGEWGGQTDSNGKIVWCGFTSESPEYWNLLAKDRYLTLSLYQKLVSPKVKESEIYHPDGTYNPYNKWNLNEGAVHLTYHKNALRTLFSLLGWASLRYDIGEQPADVPSEVALAGCAGYGSINRGSVTKIGYEINQRANEEGMLVSLANPIGPYIQGIDLSGLYGPDGRHVGDNALRIMRAGPDGKIFNFRLEIPKSYGFTLGDCSLNGFPVSYCAQFAVVTTMGLDLWVQKPATTLLKQQICPCRGARHVGKHPGHPKLYELRSSPVTPFYAEHGKEGDHIEGGSLPTIHPV